MKMIVTGANGFLGQHLCKLLSTLGQEVYAFSRGKRQLPDAIHVNYVSVELTEASSVAGLIHQIQPDSLIHTAAMSKPDICDVQRDACIANNVTATTILMDACKKTGAHFIHLSTDFIFGENGPHAETDEPDPLNFYGVSKLMAEKAVQQSGLDYTVVRPVFIYGEVWDGLRPGFIQWVQKQLTQGTSIQVVTDQLRTPTFVNDLCRGIHSIAHQRKTGVYHLAGEDILSPYEMAVQVAEQLRLDSSLIVPVTVESFPEPVRRAKKSGLRIDKAKRDLGYQPCSFSDAIQHIFSQPE